jgi:hypothetical protein
MGRALASLLLVAPLFGCGPSDTAGPGSAGDFPEAPYATLKSDSGALTIEVRTSPEQPPTRGVLDIEYRIRDASGPRDDLDIDVLPWMTAMGHGASTKPVVHTLDHGHYILEGVQCVMPGGWELRTTLTSDAGGATDHATPTLDVR